MTALPDSRFRDCANAVRFLAIDAVEHAQSGHPGMPMGMADIATVLWQNHLSYAPTVPDWINRDRFVLSNGHGSMLLYALLHLSGYDLSIDDIRCFRTFGSKTPGHPEYGRTPGVETTTGPLGQGIANAVGMALAQKLLAAQFNRPNFPIIDHDTWVFLGDGCMMEGISHEVCALAATWKLDRLIAVWDDNGISIDGETKDWHNEDVPARFRAYGWHVIENIDGHDPSAIEHAITAAKAQHGMPVLLCCRTIIGFGSPNHAGHASAHGAPLGKDEIDAVRTQLQWPHASFTVPEYVYADWDMRRTGDARYAKWQQLFTRYTEQFPKESAALQQRLSRTVDEDVLTRAVAQARADTASVATRKASLQFLNTIQPQLPVLLGGSADLTGSNLTKTTTAVPITGGASGDYVYFGVREFGMAAITNGIALYGGFRPFCGTFLVFSDYMRNAMRLSALMHLPVVYVLTHDSIGLGEDGPTHQPIEQLESLRLIPNMHVWRPADAYETAVAWQQALLCTTTPSVLALSRQSLPAIDRMQTIGTPERGGYVVYGSAQSTCSVIVIATGSEVHMACAAAAVLMQENICVRVVSMPCREIFSAQDAAYKASILFPDVPVIAVEAGSAGGWYRLADAVIGIDTFGESAPADTLFTHFGLTPPDIAAYIRRFLSPINQRDTL